MATQLKPLEDQVVVITGASSGIGLVTARMAAQRGARLVLAARSEAELRDLVEEIQGRGGEAAAVVADVGNPEDVRRIRTIAEERFGGFDTWVNNAGVGMFGRIVDVPVDDMKKLFDTNVWGLVYGSLEAVDHFRTRGERRYAGALINIGSVLSYQPIPLQGPYVASKHAVKGFTDSLRQELEHDDMPVSVTCVMPNAINTPYPQHAPRYTEKEPTIPPPWYAPETVARTILHAATHPVRNITVGGAFKPTTALNKILPGVVDSFMKAFMFAGQQKDEPAEPGTASLRRAGGRTSAGAGQERGDDPGLTLPFSAYTSAKLHPLAAAAVLAGVGLLLGAVFGLSGDDD